MFLSAAPVLEFFKKRLDNSTPRSVYTQHVQKARSVEGGKLRVLQFAPGDAGGDAML
jgi:hypothetical protein